MSVGGKAVARNIHNLPALPRLAANATKFSKSNCPYEQVTSPF